TDVLRTLSYFPSQIFPMKQNQKLIKFLRGYTLADDAPTATMAVVGVTNGLRKFGFMTPGRIKVPRIASNIFFMNSVMLCLTQASKASAAWIRRTLGIKPASGKINQKQWIIMPFQDMATPTPPKILRKTLSPTAFIPSFSKRKVP